MSDNNAYVYGHYKADTGELFYIGKGTGKRAWSKEVRNSHWLRIVNKHGIEIKILYKNLSEEEAFQKEKELIAEIGLKNLTNIAEGGKGFTSEEAKKLAEWFMQDPDWHRKMAERTQDPEWRRKNAERAKKMAQDPEWRRKNSEKNKKYRKNATLVSPSGDIFHVNGIVEFAQLHGLNDSHLSKVINKKHNHHKGWRLHQSEEDHKISELT